jgi:hypothetical protein
MAYTRDLADAARRHREAADCLYDSAPPCRRRDVAGYLYGLAAECAFKQILHLSTDWREVDRDDSAFYAHFPDLKSLARDHLNGRHASVLRRFVECDAFMNEWHVKMRYGSRRAVPDRLVEHWREQATDIIAAMEDC